MWVGNNENSQFYKSQQYSIERRQISICFFVWKYVFLKKPTFIITRAEGSASTHLDNLGSSELIVVYVQLSPECRNLPIFEGKNFFSNLQKTTSWKFFLRYFCCVCLREIYFPPHLQVQLFLWKRRRKVCWMWVGKNAKNRKPMNDSEQTMFLSTNPTRRIWPRSFKYNIWIKWSCTDIWIKKV